MSRFKQQKYTLLDQFYFDALVALTEELNAQNVHYAVVGGTAVQAHIAGMLTGQRKTLKSISGFLKIKIQFTLEKL